MSEKTELKAQRQDAMRDQMDDLLKIAVQEGMYDAHQFILDCLNTRATPDESGFDLTDEVKSFLVDFANGPYEDSDPDSYIEAFTKGCKDLVGMMGEQETDQECDHNYSKYQRIDGAIVCTGCGEQSGEGEG